MLKKIITFKYILFLGLRYTVLIVHKNLILYKLHVELSFLEVNFL